MGRLFGTDGVRGVANGDLTPELALGVSAAAARVLAPRVSGEAGATAPESAAPTEPSAGGADPAARCTGRPTAVVGRDPRASGEFLEAAVVAGLAGAGVDVLRVGVLPTPATAYLTGALGADFGVMLSASHNPMPDNGIKFFARGGHKLADELEDRVEAVYRDMAAGQPWNRPVGAAVGRVTDHDAGFDAYVAHLIGVLPNRLDGLRIVVDAAHGAASRVAPEAFARAGADVISIGTEPNGLNINDGCGSTHLDAVRAAVVEHGADLGIAVDGDADRCLAVDADGQDVDGDQILAVLAMAMREAGTLRRDTVVATVMSNLGFKLALEDAGLTLRQTAVGDRYVLEEMKRGGYALGGEQSGHVVVLDHATTGDGTLTGLLLAARVAAQGRPLGELAGVMRRLPQVLVNVRDVDKDRTETSPELAAAVAAAEAELGETGRVLLRPSGTEPLVRVMVEAADADHAREVADRLAEAVRTALGGALLHQS